MQTGVDIFVSRLNGAKMFDLDGENVGTVRDVILILSERYPSRAVGFLAEVYGKRRVFIPLSRVTSISSSQVIITGLLNMRRFQKRELEVLGYHDFFGRVVELPENIALNEDNKNQEPQKMQKWKVEDFAIKLQPNLEWQISQVFIRRIDATPKFPALFSKKPTDKQGETRFIGIKETLSNSGAEFNSDFIIESMEQMNAADAADVFMDLEEKRQLEIAKDLDNERLADVLEEMPELEQAHLLEQFETDDAADVLEEMEPDDAADLLNTMPKERAEELLGKMQQEEADDVRRLMEYSGNTAGGLMTPNPVILTANSTVAFALAKIRQEQLSPSLASVVFVCKQPLETPTGQFLGIIHFQELLRLAPHQYLGNVVNSDTAYVTPAATIEEVSRVFATYNSINVPVLDSEGRLVGAITVDDVLDHILPTDWRDDEVRNGGTFNG
jgi:flagellar motility protein MotE (MotC chaperone)/sporulation protein YlmC with PRC-barrel domain